MSDSRIGEGVIDGNGVGVDVGVGVGVGICVTVGDGDVGDGDGERDRVGVGEGEGCSTGSSVDGDSVVSAGSCFDAGDGERLGVDPGSNHELTLFPLTKVACNRV